MLWSQPSSDSVLSVISDDTAQMTVHPEALTFTRDDWNSPQPVTITVVDDDVFDGLQTTTVTVSGVGGNWYASEESLWVYVEEDEGLNWHLHRQDGGDGDIKVSESGSTYTFEL